MSHLKRIAAPKSWPLKQRKGITFIAKPRPGPHKIKAAITLNTILKELLSHAKTTKEVKIILNKGKVIVNKKTRKDHKFPIGAMDTISIPENKENYILLYDQKGKFYLNPIKEEDAASCIGKIINKKILKGKKIQLNLHNGNNILVQKDTFKVGDTILYNGNKVTKHIKLEKGSKIYLVDGKYKGKSGVLEKIDQASELSSETVTIKSKDQTITTTKKYAFAINKEFKK